MGAPLPHPAGSGPFKVKGLALVFSRKYLDEHYGGGFLDALPDDDSRRFFREPLLASSWYDAMPMLHVAHAASQLMGTPPAVAVRDLTVAHAEHDLNRVHRMLLKVARPEDIIPRLARLTSQYWSFGAIDLERVDDSGAAVIHTGLPARMYAYFHVVDAAYIGFVLRQTGWSVTIESRTWRPSTSQHGQPCVDIPYELSWRRG